MAVKIIPHSDLKNSNLTIDAIYEGGSLGNASDDPIHKILSGSGNMGGFRASGRGTVKNYVVLYTDGADADWPDTIDLNTGRFTYYGDNKKPGHDLHDTPRGGNTLLRTVFDSLHDENQPREKIPPFFIFMKYPTPKSKRSVQFKGLAVPGYPGLTATEDLVAVWKNTKGQRFQNYKATFTILKEGVIKHSWINNLSEGKSNKSTPPSWKKWLETGIYNPLTAERTSDIREISQQLPTAKNHKEILSTIYNFFKDNPITFESFAAHIFKLQDQRVIIDEVTRATVDGGRDAIGRYLLGIPEDPVYVDFALEAKCYRPPSDEKNGTSVGVKETSRLISRIRHRQFGVLVTTSFLAKQAYEELREDQHPIIVISGKDIVDILVFNGIKTKEAVSSYLEKTKYLSQ